ncbi:MAG: HPr family phosphocarrier protein [Planctomycetes bacterium]|nr:HPr family phosphocarrier protein [Planctomycetota bacterium]
MWDAGLASLDDADLGAVRRRLPRNLGQEDPADDSQRIAEIASKFLAACTMLESLDLRVVADANALRGRVRTVCKEEQARVYEATVHNLQSTYDTHIKNTLVESQDERLPRLRGLLSAALHLLETVTVLAHFVERHESEARSEPTSHAIASIVQADRVRALMLNELLHWANILMQRGRVTAEELLPSYIELRELRVELPPSLKLHARPAALIVNIVAHHGTPVELEIGTHRCNAGSILEILIGVGSNPEVRHFLFRGDIHPLNDISLLFESNLGEDGLGNLPAALQYLRER